MTYVKEPHSPFSRNKPLSLTDWVEGKLAPISYDAGQLEEMSTNVTNLTGAFARLLDTLHDKGVLTLDEVAVITCNWSGAIEEDDNA